MGRKSLCLIEEDFEKFIELFTLERSFFASTADTYLIVSSVRMLTRKV